MPPLPEPAPSKRKYAPGYSYLPVFKRIEPENVYRVQIRSVRTCLHTNSICTRCVHSWEKEWHLDYKATRGGRALHHKLEIADATAQMVGRSKGSAFSWSRRGGPSYWDHVPDAMSRRQEAIQPEPLSGRHEVMQEEARPLYQQVTCACGASTYADHKKRSEDPMLVKHPYSGPYKPATTKAGVGTA